MKRSIGVLSVVALTTVLVASSCGSTTTTSAHRTLMGVDQRIILISAHRLLSDRSFEIESIDSSTGQISTEWRNRGLRSVRYDILAKSVAGSNEGAVELEVASYARDRAVKGWTSSYPAVQNARRFAKEIARAAEHEARNPLVPLPPLPVVEEQEEQQRPAETACSGSSECPPGQHCGSGRCVWECVEDRECADDQTCDRRGRCVSPPPPPPPPANTDTQTEEE